MKKQIQWTAGLVMAITASIAHAAPTTELKLTPQDAVSRAVLQNLDLKYERLSPELTDAGERSAGAVFDPTFFADANAAGAKGTIKAGGDVGIRKIFSTTGTTVEAKVGTTGVFGEEVGRGPFSPEYETALSLTVRQPLLRGSSRQANEVGITGAKLQERAAQDKLSRKAELVAADTLKSYWDLHAALSQAQVQKVALDLARKTLAETQALIQAGKLAAAEEAAANYQVQVQTRASVQADQAVENARDRLARLMGLVDARSLDTPALVTMAMPKTELPAVTLASLQAKALEKRGDREAAKLERDARAGEAKAADHNLLPQLDIVGGLTVGGMGGDPVPGSDLGNYDTGYWASYEPKHVGWSVGLMLTIPIGNEAAKARKKTTDLQQHQAEVNIDRIDQQISQDLNVAWRGVHTARTELELTESAAALAQTKAENELTLYRAGKSSAQILTTVQADLVKERLAKEQALANFNKSLVDLYTASGTLVENLNLKVS